MKELSQQGGNLGPMSGAVVAFAARAQGKEELIKWEGTLAKLLADASEKGDRRARLLFAKANAIEALAGHPDVITTKPLAVEALDVAESDGLRFAAVEWLVRRFLISNDFTSAIALLDGRMNNFTDSSAIGGLAILRTQLKAFADAADRKQAKLEEARSTMLTREVSYYQKVLQQAERASAPKGDLEAIAALVKNAENHLSRPTTLPTSY